MSSESGRLPTLQGKTAIVTGASRGIGAGIAEELARRGAKVLLTYTSDKSDQVVEDLIKKFSEFNGHASKVKADLSDPAAANTIVEAATKAFGKQIDVLVNNAGVLFSRSIADTTAEDYAKIYNVNVRGPILMTKAVLPYLPQHGGRIINVSSVGARDGNANMALYCSSKAALEGLTRCWAAELGVNGHTVNAVNPGPTESDMLNDVPKEVIEPQKAKTAVEKRVGTANDIAQIVSWLASEDSRWVSGQCISASGGYAMY